MRGLLVPHPAVALGLAAVLAASSLAFTLLKFVGAAYLAYLAWGALRAPVGSGGAAAADRLRTGRAQAWRLVGRGVVMNLTNPKVLIFFLAFLPQFADPARGGVAAQFWCWAWVFVLAALLVFGAVACFSGSSARCCSARPARSGVFNRLTGLVVLGLAVRLATVQASVAIGLITASALRA